MNEHADTAGTYATAEHSRMATFRAPGRPWRMWGPYLSERQWGTVREDYSPKGDAWRYFPHELARSRAYRWGEDGIGGFSDRKQHLCLGVALWNEKDRILKERLFGLKNGEGNHGEDVKEIYYYLDGLPSHAYMKMLYKYPQRAFPYEELTTENLRRTKADPEYELIDTGIFAESAYFDVFVEYAKASPDDILLKVTAINRGASPAPLHLMPSIWCRNTWSWGAVDGTAKPTISRKENHLHIDHPVAGTYHAYWDGTAEALFCENETNYVRTAAAKTNPGGVKDGINDFVTSGDLSGLNSDSRGTKVALWYRSTVDGGEAFTAKIRLSKASIAQPFGDFDQIFETRVAETDAYYASLQKQVADSELRSIQRQAWAGLLWTKQYFYYHVNTWLKGDNAKITPPPQRLRGRNRRWRHLYADNILTMPDKWEYPWFAVWDTAFQCVAMARIDAQFAKEQLILPLREYYMHPNGQIPAYEWNFSDVNPPVHAYGAWQVYCIDREINGGKGDIEFLSVVFHKLLMNFTWWLNIKDSDGNSLFEGGFLGLDNIGVFDRSKAIPGGGRLDQADGTSWMGMYALNMLRIALELAGEKPYYQEMASKFFSHFLNIAGAMANIDGEGTNLWDEEEGFYFDIFHPAKGDSTLLKVRSMVGLSVLFAMETVPAEMLERSTEFNRRLERSLRLRPDLAALVHKWQEPGIRGIRLLSLVRLDRVQRILQRMLDENEFLSPYGIRALSKHHLAHPYVLHLPKPGEQFEVKYVPGESDTHMFGGNSNWRGPVWFPVNQLLIDSLYKLHAYFGDALQLEYPTGSGQRLTAKEVAAQVSLRLIGLFKTDADGQRPANGGEALLDRDPHFKDYITFYEYFHGDHGRGLGASHQTGWTGLVGELIHTISRM